MLKTILLVNLAFEYFFKLLFSIKPTVIYLNTISVTVLTKSYFSSKVKNYKLSKKT